MMDADPVLAAAEELRKAQIDYDFAADECQAARERLAEISAIADAAWDRLRKAEGAMLSAAKVGR